MEARKVLDGIIELVRKAIEGNEEMTWDAPVVEGFKKRPFNAIWNREYKGLFNSLYLSFISMDYGDPRYVACSYVKRMTRSGVLFAKGSKWHWVLKPIMIPLVNESKAIQYGLDPKELASALRRDSRSTLTKYPKADYPELFFFKPIGYEELPVVNIRETTGILGKVKDSEGNIIPESLDSRKDEDKPKGGFEILQNLVDSLGVNVQTVSSAIPFYSPVQDFVGMPKAEMFKDSFVLSEALAHEVIHWTGHESRCNRDLKGMGQENYSRDELIACLGSSLLLASLGVDMTGYRTERQAAYLKSWMQPLQNDPQMLLDAAKDAEKAVRFILKLANEGVEEGVEVGACAE